MSRKYAFMIMIQDKWWQEFRRRCLQGKETHSYVRLGVSAPKETSMILFYVTKPVGEVAGYADFIERRVGDTEQLWKEYGHESVLTSKDKYDEFVRGRQNVSFIRFRSLHEAATRIPLNHLLLLLGVRRLARKGFHVGKEAADKLIAQMG